MKRQQAWISLIPYTYIYFILIYFSYEHYMYYSYISYIWLYHEIHIYVLYTLYINIVMPKSSNVWIFEEALQIWYFVSTLNVKLFEDISIFSLCPLLLMCLIRTTYIKTEEFLLWKGLSRLNRQVDKRMN